MSTKGYRVGRPKMRESTVTASFTFDGNVINTWKKLCDKKEWNYSNRIESYMREDLSKNMLDEKIQCPLCPEICNNVPILIEHGDRKHKDIGGIKLFAVWKEKKAKSQKEAPISQKN